MDHGLIEPRTDQLSYSSYLKINELTSLQIQMTNPAEHDELLFIVIHQVYELWFKQILHEVDASIRHIREDEILSLVRSLSRIRKILEVCTHQVDVLETMTPTDFGRFRQILNPASGFQSHQFRLLEFAMGLKDSRYLRFFKDFPDILSQLEAALRQPSLYDHFLQHMARSGLAVPRDLLERDFSIVRPVDVELTQVFLKVYRESKQYSQLYMASEALIDFDEQFVLWRYRHVAMVERMIGKLGGTGGSSGAKYLATTLEKRFFPEIWEVRNFIGGATYG